MAEEEENTTAEVTYARLVSHFHRHHHHQTTNREDEQVARMHSLSRILDELTGPVERRTMGVHSVVFIAKKLIERRCEKKERRRRRRERREEALWVLDFTTTFNIGKTSEEEEIFMKNEFTNIISNELRLTPRWRKSAVPVEVESRADYAEFIKREGSTEWMAFVNHRGCCDRRMRTSAS